MLPFKDYHKVKRSYRFGVPTFYSDFHLGTDYIVPVGTPIYAWDDLEILTASVGKQGGNTITCKVDGELPLVRHLHLLKLPKKGKYKEGQIIAYTGNTGLSTAPHDHIDVSANGNLELNNRKNFTDPERYFLKYERKVSDPGIATSIPVMGETTTTAVPVQNAPNGPKIDASEAIAPEGGNSTPPPEIADSVAPKEMTIKEAIISLLKYIFGRGWKK
jgi:murein DD-endopeptidase MepM/ murein hydrolase activator NlpD